MKLSRVYLVEFRHWRKPRSRSRRLELWRQHQLNLPGLPDYGPNGRPELEARLLDSVAADPTPDALTLEAAAPSRSPAVYLALGLMLLPAIPLAPVPFILATLACLIGAAVQAKRFSHS